MSSHNWNVKVYNAVTNGFHSEYNVVAPDEENALRIAEKKFGNANRQELTPEFYKTAVTQGDEISEVSLPSSDDVAPVDEPAATVAPVEVVETNADRIARLRAEADALESEETKNG